MSHQFELIRATDDLTRLKREQDQLAFSLKQTERDELAEAERVRRDFNFRIELIKNKQETVLRDIKAAQLKQQQIQLLVDEEKRQETIDKQNKLEEERNRRLHL